MRTEARSTMSRDTVNTYDPVAGEPVNVPGHPMDREPEMSQPEARRAALNGEISADDCPIVLQSDMRADPCEGVQGTYTAVVECDCPECPSEFATESVHTLAGVRATTCLLCDYMIEEP